MQWPTGSASDQDIGPAGQAAFPVISAPCQWRSIDFISDLHLAADHPRTFEAFEAHLGHTTADAVFILGDLFDLWVGDDARQGAFESRCAAALTEASSRITIAFMAGNRDFLVGSEMLDACRVMSLADPAVLVAFGHRLLLTHGDAWCLTDIDYQHFRVQVRDPAFQREFLARPLAQRLVHAQAIRAQSEHHKRENAVADWADVDFPTAVHALQQAGARILIHGHTHQPGSELLAPGYTREVLSDWELDDPALPPRAEVLRCSSHGLQRLPPATATAGRAA